MDRQPGDYAVTVCIPHIETPELVWRAVALLQLSTVPVYIMVIDTGSTDPATIRALEELRGPDCEIHYLRAHGYRHASEPVAVAMDMAMALCRTRWMLCTHADAWMTRRDAVADTLALAMGLDHPFVGYGLTPRPHWRLPSGAACDDWRWMLGHTWTMVDTLWAKERGIWWDFATGCRRLGWSYNNGCTPNIVDTEVFFNYAVREAGVEPYSMGGEENYKRNQTEHFDHVRSYPSAQLYLKKGSALRQQQARWLKSALRAADNRIEEWRGAE